ncbi:MAG: DoxX family protein [Flavobacteriaceae bacterium]
MDIITKYPAELLILLFLIVTFLQSGIDKITDWNGNVDFIKGHFKNSPLKNAVPFLLGVVLLLEIIASLSMIYGIYEILSSGTSFYALIGVELSALTLIFLLIGQRLAKDYAGAMSLAVYFIVTILGLFALIY